MNVFEFKKINIKMFLFNFDYIQILLIQIKNIE